MKPASAPRDVDVPVRLGLGDALSHLRTPFGRLQLLKRALDWAWPLLRGPSALYRRTLIRNTCVVAVVGSFGKSTAARAIVTALGDQPHRYLLFNIRSGVALALLRIRPGRRQGVLEVGINRPGQMVRHARTVRPDITVVTSIGSEHNRSFKTLEVTRAEKAEMVRVLPASGWAILNGDDPNVRWMAGQTSARVMTFGLDETNDVRATEPVVDWPHGTRFLLHTSFGTRSVRVRLIGRPMIYPILAAVAVGLSEEIPLDLILSRLESLEPTPGRLEPVLLANGAVLLRDDQKAPLETIEAALEVLANIPAQRRVVVLGGVDEPVGSQRLICRRLGERVAQIASQAVFVTGDNFTAYAAGAKHCGMARDAVMHARGGVQGILQALPTDLGPGDVVLVKGRRSQRLERAVLALLGRTVRCELKQCGVQLTACHECPMLERGWEGRRVVV